MKDIKVDIRKQIHTDFVDESDSKRREEYKNQKSNIKIMFKELESEIKKGKPFIVYTPMIQSSACNIIELQVFITMMIENLSEDELKELFFENFLQFYYELNPEFIKSVIKNLKVHIKKEEKNDKNK